MRLARHGVAQRLALRFIWASRVTHARRGRGFSLILIEYAQHFGSSVGPLIDIKRNGQTGCPGRNTDVEGHQ
jgi:hypothetical protein